MVVDPAAGPIAAADAAESETAAPDAAGLDAAEPDAAEPDAHGGESPPDAPPADFAFPGDGEVVVELQLDDEAVAFLRSGDDKDRRLAAGTRINGRAGPDAEINLRGKGTLRCRRRSFTVRFKAPIRIGDSPPLEHALLLSMCADEGYLKMHSSMGLLAEMGLFPAWFRYVELRYGGETRGVYLLVERPRKALPYRFPDNEVVLRRVSDDVADVERPDNLPESALTPYFDLYDLPARHDDGSLLPALRRRLDYDQYLRWLAVNSALENGDYVDEVFFYDGAPAPGDHEAPWFSVMAWDYDDIFEPCHVGGPIAEPLLFCAESALDRPVRDDPAVRAVYAEVLSALLDGPLSEAAYAALLEASLAELGPLLADPEVGAVMFPGEVDAVAAARAHAAELRERAAARRAALRRLLAAE